MRESLPKVMLVELSTNQEYFVTRHRELDALLISAESGSAFCLQNPSFEVVVPSELNASLPLLYAIGAGDVRMKNFLEHWISLRRKDGTIAEYYDHWILGKTAAEVQSRWCVLATYWDGSNKVVQEQGDAI